MTPEVYIPGFPGASALCDSYFSWDDAASGKVRGFLFWFEDCFQPPTYFVPMADGADCKELNLEDALEVWIDYLYERKSSDVVGGGYEGSQSVDDWAKENEDQDLAGLLFGASFYAIPFESWQCREVTLEVSGLEYAKCECCNEEMQCKPGTDEPLCSDRCRSRVLSSVLEDIDLLLDEIRLTKPAVYDQIMVRPFRPEQYSLTIAKEFLRSLEEVE